jgi:hypothetical protein
MVLTGKIADILGVVAADMACGRLDIRFRRHRHDPHVEWRVVPADVTL